VVITVNIAAVVVTFVVAIHICRSKIQYVVLDFNEGNNKVLTTYSVMLVNRCASSGIEI